MEDPSFDILAYLANLAVLTASIAGITIWLAILRCVLQRRPLVPFEPRRPVPWGGLDLLAVLLGYVCLGASLALAANQFLGWKFDEFPDQQQTEKPRDEAPLLEAPTDTQQTETDEADDEIDMDRAHPVVVLLSGDSSPGTFLLCVFAVVVMAPVSEEFFFRLMLQGYLEKVDFRWHRLLRYSGHSLGLVPILLSSLLFASLHAREPETPRAVEQLIRLFAIDSLAKFLVVTGAVAYLKIFREATWTDLGLKLGTFWKDLGLAVAAFLAVVVPIYMLQEGLGQLLPDTVPDPAPLFFLALTLGYLYFRTHRLTPAILLHLIFNATALCMFFAVTSTP